MRKPPANFEEALHGSRESDAAEERWSALYGLGRIHRRQHEIALAIDTLGKALNAIESARSAPAGSGLKTEFLASKREVYDAAIDLLVET